MTEKELHKSICNYIKLQYPKALFNSDGAGLRLTMGQATQYKSLRSCNGFPDIIVFEPNKSWSALCLEVKKETPFKKDGSLKTDKHLEEQYNLHKQFNLRNFSCYFVWDFDYSKSIIDKYFKNLI